MTQCQNFDATSGMGQTIFLVLSIGHHVKFDTRASKFVTPASNNLPVGNPCLIVLISTKIDKEGHDPCSRTFFTSQGNLAIQREFQETLHKIQRRPRDPVGFG